MKTVYLLILSVFVFSCQQEKSTKIITNDYDLSITAQNDIVLKSEITVSQPPFVITAEKIALKELVNIIFKTDTLSIQFENDEIANKPFDVNLEFKNEDLSSKKRALKSILKTSNLDYTTAQKPVTYLAIIDTLKLYKHYAKEAATNKTRMYKSNDSISIENISLKKLASIVSKEFSTNLKSHNTNALITFNFRFKDLYDVKSIFKNQLGLEFQESNETQTTYIIKETK